MLKFNHTPDGAFVAGDTTTGITCYAYPTSEHATKAKKNPLKVAEAMILGEMLSLHESADGKDYDARNWAQIA
jgi:hypothetical protein